MSHASKMEAGRIFETRKPLLQDEVIFALRAEDSGPTNFKLHSKDPSSGCQCREVRARPRAAAPSSVSLNLYRQRRLFAPLSSDLLLCEKKAKKKKNDERRRRSEPAAISPEVNFLPDWRSVIVGICITRPAHSSCAPFARRTSRWTERQGREERCEKERRKGRWRWREGRRDEEERSEKNRRRMRERPACQIEFASFALSGDSASQPARESIRIIFMNLILNSGERSYFTVTLSAALY